MNNGYTSIFFPLTKGVRQGCPLSSLLFILVVETLAINIRNNNEIKGVMFQENEVKISLLADDTTIFTEDVESLEIVLNTIHNFRKSSGLKINHTKTKIMQVGLQRRNIDKLKIAEVNKIYSLGTWFFTNTETINAFNYDCKYKQFKSVLKYWEQKHLNILEKIKIIKTYALSKLNYIMSSLEINEPFVQNLQKDINNFIWDGKKPKIRQKVAYQNIQKGGLAIPNIENLVKANRAMWIKRLLSPNNRSSQYLSMFIPKIKINHFVKCNYDPKDLPQGIPNFYHQILFAWFSFKRDPTTPLEVRREIIVLNRYISIDNQYFYNKKLILNNLIMIHNFFNENGTPIKYDTFVQNHGNIISRFKYMTIIDAIPLGWRKILKTKTIEADCCNINEDPFCQINKVDRNVFRMTSRELYWAMIYNNLLQPSCIQAWNLRLHTQIQNATWEKIFILPFQCTQNINVKMLQLKIIHRFYASQSLISKWDTETNATCCLCKTHIANLLHTFQTCIHVKSFWAEIEKWLKDIMILYTAELKEPIILFGIVPYTIGNHCINHCLMYCKLFIHMEHANERIPRFDLFKSYYRNILQTEKEMYLVRNEKTIFNNLFRKLLNLYNDVM